MFFSSLLYISEELLPWCLICRCGSAKSGDTMIFLRSALWACRKTESSPDFPSLFLGQQEADSSNNGKITVSWILRFWEVPRLGCCFSLIFCWVWLHSVVCCSSLCNPRLGLCTPRHERDTFLSLSCALALLFTSSPPHQVITAVPCTMYATNFKTCPASPRNLHHWCNQAVLLCGYNYYYSICIAPESPKGIIWDLCWFKWDQNDCHQPLKG